MSVLIWVLVALGLLGLLMLLVVGNSGKSFKPGQFLGPEDVIEGGLFVIAFTIVLLPLYPVYVLSVAIWRRFHPPVVLPVREDDPVWNRNVNRKMIEESYLAVQQAWMARDPDSVKELVGPDLYADLKRECDRLTARHEVNTRQDIQIQESHVHDVKISDSKTADGKAAMVYHLDAAVHGTITNYVTSEADDRITAGSSARQEFKEKLQFDRKAGSTEHWVMLSWSGLPHSKDAEVTPR